MGTILSEYVALILLIRKEPLNLFIYTVLINGVTNPLLNYCYLILDIPLILLETGVVCTEMILIYLLAKVDLRYAGICSVCANGFSTLTGLLWHIRH
ncbi:hypothetical protein [Methanospirillum lacunae]|uniref:Uncharacterized protein n=1 Tax=Methanospirillum lacunae TaxID=668570 RepID=A0A2V2N282_9EURY|nr:hypothetical protein [Methanospirillum lacunae]PWR72730.1 hypothetical protein DK846_07200 [Methanospirillum lacunae]